MSLRRVASSSASPRPRCLSSGFTPDVPTADAGSMNRLPPYEQTHLVVDDGVLVPWRASDAAAIADAYRADPEIPRRTGFAYEMTIAEAAAYIAERRPGVAGRRQGCLWHLRRRRPVSCFGLLAGN